MRSWSWPSAMPGRAQTYVQNVHLRCVSFRVMSRRTMGTLAIARANAPFLRRVRMMTQRLSKPEPSHVVREQETVDC